MNFKSVASAFAFLALASAAHVEAAPWTVTTTGTISYGYDYGNINDLSGKTYTLSITVDPSLYTGQYNDGSSVAYGNGYNSGFITDTLTIDGISWSYTLTPFSGSGVTYLADINNYGSGIFSEIFNNHSGHTANSETSVGGYSYLYSYSNHVNNGSNFDQHSFYTAQPGDYGQTFFTAGHLHIEGNVSTIAINGGVAAVPEPETYAMLLAGLGLMGAVARKKRALA